MPEVKNTFIGAKMNKDLNPRLISNREYIDARNASVMNSEDDNSGVLQNVHGNITLTDFGLTDVNLDIIGFYLDTINNRLFAFITNWNDTSTDRLSNFAPSTSSHYIYMYNNNTDTYNKLVEGSFLNLSKTNPVLGVNLLEDLLFFTDNRNQPRKINVTTAAADATYYSKEEHISVAKYYPFNAPVFSKYKTNRGLIVGSQLMITSNMSVTYQTPPGQIFTNIDGKGASIQITTGPPLGAPAIILSAVVTVAGTGNYSAGDVITLNNVTGAADPQDTFSFQILSENIEQEPTMKDVVSEYLPYTAQALSAASTSTSIVVSGVTGSITSGMLVEGSGVPSDTTVVSFSDPNLVVSQSVNVAASASLQFSLPNPDLNVSFDGDIDFTKDKFIRFAYRFKYDDDEYSIISPFSQPAFIPKQDGYFLGENPNSYLAEGKSDEIDAFKSSIISFFENKVNKAIITIDLPNGINTVGDLDTGLKVKEVDIIYKESDALSLKVLDTLTSAQLNTSEIQLTYTYNSQAPIRTLPSNELSRVSDKVPIRAASQEIASNRVIYGNYLVRFKRQSNVDFNLHQGEKYTLGQSTDSTSAGVIRVYPPTNQQQYPNHNCKQNRSYKVGVVLCDIFGRQSDVMTSPGASTTYNKYFTGNQISATDTYLGNSLKIEFNDAIASDIAIGEIGLYSATNPLGWYSYKVVVQQKGQDYYNVFLPTILNNTPQSEFDVSITTNQTDFVDGTYTGTVSVTTGYTTDSDDGNDMIITVTVAGNTVTKVTVNQAGTRYRTGDQIFVTGNGGVLGGSSGNLLLTLNTSSITDTKDLAFITLLGDNINKIPRDLNEVGPLQVQFNSSVNIFPRVHNINYVSTLGTNKQYSTAKTPDKVVLIGQRDDLGLDKSIEGQVYNTSPFFGMPNVPTTSNSNKGSNYLIGQVATQDAVGSIGGFTSPNVSYERIRLNVYETEPVFSNIDIFYESGTNGVISELNNFITRGNGSTINPALNRALISEITYFNSYIIKKVVTREATGRQAVYPGLPWNPTGYPVFPSRAEATENDFTWFLEESRIRGGYNNTQTDLAPRAFITETNDERLELSNGLIYSGLYNSRTGFNETNVFSVAESITKNLDPRYGGIQRLYTTDTNLTIFQEDKVSRTFVDKDAIYTADGNPAVTASNVVLGSIQQYGGEYGISSNPESFAFKGYRIYFADKYRGSIMRLSRDGLTEISSYGMRDFFRDKLRDISDVFEDQVVTATVSGSSVIGLQISFDSDVDFSSLELGMVIQGQAPDTYGLNGLIINQISQTPGDNWVKLNSTFLAPAIGTEIKFKKFVKDKVVGGYDNYLDKYVVSLQQAVTAINGGVETGGEYNTVSFNESNNGWTSFWDYKPSFLNTLDSTYFTCKDATIWKHYNNSVTNNRGSFYGTIYPSTVQFSFNPNVSFSKNFNTVNYEGSNGWELDFFLSDPTEQVYLNPNYNSYKDQSSAVYSYLEGKYVEDGVTYHVGFNRKENKYYANLINKGVIKDGVTTVPQGLPGQVINGIGMSGIKGYFATVKLSTDSTTDIGGQKTLFAVSANFV